MEGDAFGKATITPVFAIPNDWVTGMGQLNAYLMLATGDKFDLQEGQPPMGRARLVAKLSLLSVGMVGQDDVHAAMTLVFANQVA